MKGMKYREECAEINYFDLPHAAVNNGMNLSIGKEFTKMAITQLSIVKVRLCT